MTDMPHSGATGTSIAPQLLAVFRPVIAWASKPAVPRADPGTVAGHRLAAAQRRAEARRLVDRLLR